MTAYRKRPRRFPLRIPRGPRTGLVGAYEELRLDVTPPPVRERPANRWISDKTWAAIDKRATLRRQGTLPLCVAHQLGWEIKASLAADCRQRAANAAADIEGHLGAGNLKEAWCTLKGWYRLAEDRPPPACHDTMVKQTAERVELYARVPPMGPPLPYNFPFFAIPDGLPEGVKERASRWGYRYEGRAPEGVA